MTTRSPSLCCLIRSAPAVSSMSPACAPMARMVRAGTVVCAVENDNGAATIEAMKSNAVVGNRELVTDDVGGGGL